MDGELELPLVEEVWNLFRRLSPNLTTEADIYHLQSIELCIDGCDKLYSMMRDVLVESIQNNVT